MAALTRGRVVTKKRSIMPRIYHPDLILDAIPQPLTEAASQHVARVLRMQVGDPLSVFDGKGTEAVARIEQLSKQQVTIIIESQVDSVAESPLKIHLVQGISRGERMDFVVQKSVELGVASITPLFTERCEVKLTGDRLEKRIAHWQKVAVSACEQSGRSVVPAILPARTLEPWLQQLSGQAVIGDPLSDQPLSQLVVSTSEITLAIGPEGGFSEHELQQARQAQVSGVTLGPRILRTETAALVAITVLQSCFGDL